MSAIEVIEQIKALPKTECARVIEYVHRLEAARRQRRGRPQDLDIINRRAHRLNREATDVLNYQVAL
ncbi:MAG: hypothetical protein HY360_05140 [Verrucomicrobia bacterium]|nr:hypothetical protein [Verrucomicrobiota bacterium]